jgi:hypothetical protein
VNRKRMSKGLMIIALCCIFSFSFHFTSYSQDMKEYALSSCYKNLKVVRYSWRKDGFGAVAVVSSITIKNNSKVKCKNILCAADFSSANGTHLGGTPFVIYDTIAEGKTRTFRDINIGLLPSPSDQIRKANIETISAIAE